MMEPSALVEEAREALGADRVAAGAAADAVAGVVPRLVGRPRDADDVCRLLAWADARRLAVVPTGGTTKVGWGSPPRIIDVALSTRRLTAVIEHRHEDLTATVQAGATLEAVNDALGARGQWLPCDPSWPDLATIGGVLATNDSGPRRHRHGAPRDLLIGITFVTPDGTLARAGGRVVKNVAGYDIGKLLVGSHGSLAVIVDATFKLQPRSPDSRTVEVGGVSAEALTGLARAVSSSEMVPSAVEITWPPARALVRFESVEPAVVRQAESAYAIARGLGATARILDAGEEAACWREHATRPWSGDAAVVGLGLPASQVGGELDWLGRVAEARGVAVAVAGRLAMGSLRVSLAGSSGAQVAILRDLRDRRLERGGHVLVLRASDDLRRAVDPWGPLGDAAPIMRAVKARFDPNGVLSPGRWPGAEEAHG
jgi:glycolate oxidase FAD binding subunit